MMRDETLWSSVSITSTSNARRTDIALERQTNKTNEALVLFHTANLCVFLDA